MAAQVPTDPRLVAYVGTKRLAQLLDFSETTVRDLARRGEIPKPIRIGGSMRWKWSDVETYIERGSTGSEAPDDPILKASRGS
ncbi:MAG: helix-turn-helix domain-containing protein [Alphaproteobacteria bacterium]|nr:helix-turn-helix domain-containing protein [Alphaproteobacteria bacterium]